MNINYVWISKHYDIHLEGICLDDNEKLCKFTTDYDTGLSVIYPLSWIQKIQWKKRQKLFEWCVGYHWTYPYRKQGANFHYRSPKWFWRIIFNLYFHRLKFIWIKD